MLAEDLSILDSDVQAPEKENKNDRSFGSTRELKAEHHADW